MNTAIAETGTQNIRISRAYYETNQKGAQQVQGGDFLAIMLQQLTGTMDTDAAGAIIAQMQDMQGMQVMQEDEEQNGSELAMQMLAELFLPNLGADNLLSQVTDSGLVSQQTTQTPISGVAQQLIPMMQQETGELDATQNKSTQTLFQQTLSSNNENAEAMQVVSASQAGEKETTLLGGESQFQSSVLEAQKLIKAERKEEQKTQDNLIDVDKLQQEVNAGKYNNASAVQKAATELPDSNDLIAQVKTGIQQNIAQGKNEFVVKLKPEGLGEITVKMVEQDSKISLSIITSSTQVARALSGELSALRESLRALNADVHEVVTQSESAYSAAQNEQFGQNYHGHQHQQFNRHGSQQVFAQLDDEYMAAIPNTAVTLESASELDTYI